jgi:hypothetical protein
VIMFILLSGYPPFAGSSDARILQRVQQGSYSFGAREVRGGVRLVLVHAASQLTATETPVLVRVRA